MFDNSGVANDTASVITGSTDDVTETPSYGWLFSIITAIGLLLFLSLSFAFYHRRLVLKREKEEEYNSYFRLLRPDLVKFDKKMIKARSILTNTHSLESASVYKAEHYKETFEKGVEAMVTADDNEIEAKISYAEWIEKRNNDASKKPLKEQDIYLRPVQSRKHVLRADVYSEEMFGASIEALYESDNTPTGSVNIYEDKTEDADDSEVNFITKIKRQQTDNKQKNLSQIQAVNQEFSLKSSYEIIAHKQPIVKSTAETSPEERLKKKSTLEPIKQKKRMRILQRSTCNKNYVSLDVEDRDISTRMRNSEPRRNSEPGLIPYIDQDVEPLDAKLHDNENTVQFNPFNAEGEMPIKNQTRQSCNTDEKEIYDCEEHRNSRETSFPVSDDTDNKHELASSWM